MPHATPTNTARRTLLGAGLLALGGCTLDSGPAQPSGSSSPQLTDSEYDQRLVDQVALGTARALSTIERMSARYHAVAGPLAPLVALHQAHLSAMGVVSPPSSAPVVLGADVKAALTRLRSLETELQRDLAAAAGNARSGQLARVLAGMSAGVAQHGVLLAKVRVAR